MFPLLHCLSSQSVNTRQLLPSLTRLLQERVGWKSLITKEEEEEEEEDYPTA